MPLQFVLFTSFLTLLPACTSTRPAANAPLNEFIKTQLLDADLFYNTDKDFVLCLSKSAEPATGRKQYVVVEAATCIIITRGSFLPGYIKWLNNDELELFDSPGIVSEHQGNGIKKKIIRIRSTKS